MGSSARSFDADAPPYFILPRLAVFDGFKRWILLSLNAGYFFLLDRGGHVVWLLSHSSPTGRLKWQGDHASLPILAPHMYEQYDWFRMIDILKFNTTFITYYEDYKTTFHLSATATAWIYIHSYVAAVIKIGHILP